MICPWKASACLPACRPSGSGAFPFVLQIDGVPDEVRGMAEGMNFRARGEEGGLVRLPLSFV
jgi:hypothetical protein